MDLPLTAGGGKRVMEMGTGEEEAEEGAANGRVIQIGQWQFKMVSTL